MYLKLWDISLLSGGLDLKYLCFGVRQDKILLCYLPISLISSLPVKLAKNYYLNCYTCSRESKPIASTDGSVSSVHINKKVSKQSAMVIGEY